MKSRISNRRASAILLAAIVLGGLCAAGSATAQGRPIKIAVVDLDLVATQSSAGQALRAKFQEYQREAQTELASRQEIANLIRQRATEGAGALSEEKLAELQQKYEDALVDLRRLRDEKQRGGQRLQQEGLQEIEKQLAPVFEKVRDEGGYDLILNNAPGVVVMANERVDITQKVVEALNAAG